jgi:hypothetical protein
VPTNCLLCVQIWCAHDNLHIDPLTLETEPIFETWDAKPTLILKATLHVQRSGMHKEECMSYKKDNSSAVTDENHKCESDILQ